MRILSEMVNLYKTFLKYTQENIQFLITDSFFTKSLARNIGILSLNVVPLTLKFQKDVI